MLGAAQKELNKNKIGKKSTMTQFDIRPIL